MQHQRRSANFGTHIASPIIGTKTHEVEFQVDLKRQQKRDRVRDTIRFGDFVEVNPRIRLEKGKEYPYIEMADVTPGNGFVSAQKKRGLQRWRLAVSIR